MADEKPPGIFPPPALRSEFETIPETHAIVPKPPAPPAVQRMELAKRIDDRIRRKATRVVDAIADAARLDDDGAPVDGSEVDPVTKRPKGWTGVRYRIALDARKPKKSAPGYLEHMVRIHDSYQRSDAAKATIPKLGENVVINLQQNNSFTYPVKDVTEAQALPAAKKR